VRPSGGTSSNIFCSDEFSDEKNRKPAITRFGASKTASNIFPTEDETPNNQRVGFVSRAPVVDTKARLFGDSLSCAEVQPDHRAKKHFVRGEVAKIMQ
jgi:hypothetical protein